VSATPGEQGVRDIPVTAHVELYLDAAAGADTLEMILKKGSIGLVTLRFYKQSDAGDVLIQEIDHDLVDGETGKFNALQFSIPLEE
jgi:hypothetical protein